MTPERLAELREYAESSRKEGVYVHLSPDEVVELVGHVGELRGEIADLLSRLDAAAFGATQVHEEIAALRADCLEANQANESLAEDVRRLKVALERGKAYCGCGDSIEPDTGGQCGNCEYAHRVARDMHPEEVILELVALRNLLKAADGLRLAAGTTPRGASGRPLSNLYRDVRLAVETYDVARAKTLEGA